MKKYLLAISLLSLLPAGVFNSFAQQPLTQEQQKRRDKKQKEQQYKDSLQNLIKNVYKETKSTRDKLCEIGEKATEKGGNIITGGEAFRRQRAILEGSKIDFSAATIGQLKEYIKKLKDQFRRNDPKAKENWEEMYYAIHQRRDKNAKESMQIYKLTEAVKKLANIKYSNSTPDNLQQAFNELRKSEKPQEFMRGSHNLSPSNRQEIITSFKEFKNSYANVASEKSSFEEQVSRLNKLKDENKGLGDVLNGLVKTCEDCAKSIQSGR